MATYLEQFQANNIALTDVFINGLQNDIDNNILINYNSFVYTFNLPSPCVGDALQAARILIRYYMNRGFHVVNAANVSLTLKWNAPDISWQDFENAATLTINKLMPYFTAQQLYLVCTSGNDLRKYEPYYVYKELLNKVNKSRTNQMSNVYNSYKFVLGIDSKTLTNLYINMINLFATNNIIAEFLINGVLQLTWTGDIVPDVEIDDQVIDGGSF